MTPRSFITTNEMQSTSPQVLSFVLFEHIESGFEDFWIKANNFNICGVLELVDDVDDFRPKPLGQGISRFQQDGIGEQKLLALEPFR